MSKIKEGFKWSSVKFNGASLIADDGNEIFDEPCKGAKLFLAPNGKMTIEISNSILTYIALNLSIDDLIEFRDMIDKAIEDKEK